jgi:hypothetical protein
MFGSQHLPGRPRCFPGIPVHITASTLDESRLQGEQNVQERKRKRELSDRTVRVVLESAFVGREPAQATILANDLKLFQSRSVAARMRSAQARRIPTSQFMSMCVMRLFAVLRLDLLFIEHAHDADSYCLLHVTHSESPDGRVFLERFNDMWLAQDSLDDDCILLLYPFLGLGDLLLLPAFR